VHRPNRGVERAVLTQAAANLLQAHAAANRQIERLDQIGQSLQAARQALSSLRTDVHHAQDPATDADRAIARAQADLTELATALAGHLADLRRAASEPPPTRAHRY
jgi:ABC-type transporter Mla subunit MlaD